MKLMGEGVMGSKANNRFGKLKLIAIASAYFFTASVCFAQLSGIERGEQVVNILSEGQLEKIEHLFDNNLDVNFDIDGDGTPLIIAVQNGNKQLVKYLLEQGADVNRASSQDGNPLIVAASTNNIELVEYLFQQGANIDAIVEHDETALITASRAGHFQVVKYLVEQGADVNLAVQVKTVQGDELRSPLNGAKTIKIRDYLIAKGAVVGA